MPESKGPPRIVSRRFLRAMLNHMVNANNKTLPLAYPPSVQASYPVSHPDVNSSQPVRAFMPLMPFDPTKPRMDLDEGHVLRTTRRIK